MRTSSDKPRLGFSNEPTAEQRNFRRDVPYNLHNLGRHSLGRMLEDAPDYPQSNSQYSYAVPAIARSDFNFVCPCGQRGQLADHISEAGAFCEFGDTCDQVTTSAYGNPLGVPLPVVGLTGFGLFGSHWFRPGGPFVSSGCSGFWLGQSALACW